MERAVSLLFVTLAVTLAACGDSSVSAADAGSDADANGSSPTGRGPDGSTGDSGSTAPPSCSMTLSGAVTGTYACGLPLGAWGSAKNRGAIVLTYNLTGTSGIKASASVGFPGEPTTKTYSSSDGDGQSGLNVVDGKGVWAATAGTSATPLGSYTMVVTSVALGETQATGKSYRVGGTLDATLTPASGTSATGTVTMHVEFQ